MEDRTQTFATGSVFREPSYVRFWIVRICSTVSFQMTAVAVGWQMYALTHSTFALGMVGLAQFLPMLPLTLLVGHVADRFNRKTILSICQAAEGATLAVLAICSRQHWIHPLELYAAVAAIGAARAFESPSTQALVPGLVEDSKVPQAIAWSASANQTACRAVLPHPQDFAVILIQRVETKARRLLRFCVQRHLQLLNACQVVRALSQ
jgi:MFS family permease